MEIKARTKYLKISPKKMRRVIDVVRGMDAEQSIQQLTFIPRKAARLIIRTLKSALANAKHNFDLEKEDLMIKSIFVDEGPVLKRWRPRAFGRAAQIRKHASHLTVILETKIGVKAKKTFHKGEKGLKAISETEFLKQSKGDQIKNKGKQAKDKQSILTDQGSHEIDSTKKHQHITETNRPQNKKNRMGFAGRALKKVFRRKTI